MTGRYEILEQLGEGGAGSVHKARDTALNRCVAVKMLLPPAAREGAGGDNLAAEATALSSLQHPNIVAVYDLDTSGPEPLVVMELINGETLEAVVRTSVLAPADFLQVAMETVDALVAAHDAGICHRDLKPSNLMFHWLREGKWETKLLDFGLAHLGLRPARQEAAADGTVAGSVHFMAPEQFLHQPLDVRSDLYSLGCVLYYALTGAVPCGGETVEEVMRGHLDGAVPALHPQRPDIPAAWMDWVAWLMNRDPDQRPQTAADALHHLRAIEHATVALAPALPAPDMRRVVVYRSPATRKVSGGRTVAVPGKRPAKKKSSSSLRAVLIATVMAAAGTAAYLKMRKTDATPRTAAAGPPAGDRSAAEVLSAVTPAPPQEGLVIWFDAARGGRADSGRVAARPGDRIDHWEDSAPLAGNNVAQYHKGKAPAEEKAARRPQWATVAGAGGLRGSHQVMQFDGANCLIFARDRDGAGDPVAKELSGGALTWLVVFSAGRTADRQGVLCAQAGREARAWETFVEGDRVFSGVSLSGAAEHQVSLPFEAAKGFHILTVRWDRTGDRLRQWLTGPDGNTIASEETGGAAAIADTVSAVRLGALNARRGPAGDFLRGGIASLLIYNRALDDTAREAAIDYLSRRYFGVAASRAR